MRGLPKDSAIGASHPQILWYSGHIPQHPSLFPIKQSQGKEGQLNGQRCDYSGFGGCWRHTACTATFSRLPQSHLRFIFCDRQLQRGYSHKIPPCPSSPLANPYRRYHNSCRTRYCFWPAAGSTQAVCVQKIIKKHSKLYYLRYSHVISLLSSLSNPHIRLTW